MACRVYKDGLFKRLFSPSHLIKIICIARVTNVRTSGGKYSAELFSCAAIECDRN